MQIDWKLKNGTLDGYVDPDDLLGEIRISHEATLIQDEPIYLENWFNSLIDGYEAMLSGKMGVLSSDLISEPDPLLFEFSDEGVVIAYKGRRLAVCNTQEFHKAIHTAAKRLVDLIITESPGKDRTALRKIEKFLRE
ncbi:MAG TPA: hypothetical protein PKH77_28835 [Anaerolineae bacterium]|nr:hypothetical protein [Anaerolineae bacterium]